MLKYRLTIAGISYLYSVPLINKTLQMKSQNTIEYFNEVSNEFFEILGEIKYSIRLLAIEPKKKFIGFSIDTEYFSAQITILTPDNIGYIANHSCSMQLYSFDDEMLQDVLYEVAMVSIEECLLYLIDGDVYNSIMQPKYSLN